MQCRYMELVALFALLIEMAGHKVVRLHLHIRRRLLQAALSAVGTPLGKTAAGRGIDGRGDLPLEQDALRPVVDAGDRDGGKQGLGIGVERPSV